MKNSKSKNAVAYVRTATKNNTLINKQLSEIKKYATKNGYKISKEYIDSGYSGNESNRPAIVELLKDSKSDAHKAVLIFDFSRIARNPIIYNMIKTDFQKNGVKIISITDSDNSPSLFMDDMFASQHSRLLSKSIKAGIARKKLLSNKKICKTK
ncbi:MAG: hypothetical protein A2312_02240 [Candidatus Staskawiczbacteria bacterium RIFOXYB2_FULL_32_9]|uniref:Resolvase/invertase-type recombinase catalytic domain-containing protein n=1 Tax=Candidatus Staskawiczbacteria bacterium RIFOXYD1_FULL_32_13 TaxID=1802234 RepID=A0A1G2JQ17_9BACT|nr:MAG: hypothetical protein UR22_C0033G0012 [Parcubacteria group bacterium GW2011_GWC2_32_10]OGZ79971.1 MAG: hypothetical protein A2256_04075 [Candidatus Staskawiczbacteria bacterium RIFOXYA2_FULL_32_7]OGZ80258.1 MAG: hypothetical protein A2360_05005 [Candidatus Staskawiczbacteria bacterium RIFOXYB1_FULL_32_11]OGZ84107.1 MAG: hypothetical protein A2312_02240 [Candidatus Staskawiczbacteria bacterium RIFOXYB2_FULL_32_9]OGZ87330.1 MAG: hypothetical protein A2463_04545 [Candidatus Staskawiczbacter